MMSDVPWPIIRVHQRRAIAITPEGVLVRKNFRSLTEEQAVALCENPASLKSWRFIPSDEIERVTMRRGGKITKAYWQITYIIKQTSGRRVKVTIPAQDNENLCLALQEILGERFDARPFVARSCLEIFAQFVGAISLILLIAGLLTESPPIIVQGVFFLSICMLTAWASMIRKNRAGARIIGRRRKKWRLRWKFGRRPYQSEFFGWGLKILAMFLLLFALVMISLAPYEDKKNVGDYFGRILYWTVAFMPGFAVLYLGHRLCIPSFEPGQHPDKRPPILYLRAFDDDGRRTLQPTSILARIHGIFRTNRLLFRLLSLHPVKLARYFVNAECFSSEEVFALASRSHGPLVAIGRPGEALATPGADRMYVADADWQATVLEYLEKCQAVILQPAQSDGIRWEIEQVFARIPKHRVLLSMLNFKDKPHIYEEFRQTMRRDFRLDFPLSIPFQKRPALVYFEPDGRCRTQPVVYKSPLLWTFTGNAIDMRKTFRTFIEGLDGQERQPPSPVRRFYLQPILSIPLVLPLIAGFLFAIFQIRVFLHNARQWSAERIVRGAYASANYETKLVTYRGKQIDYEFQLHPLWKKSNDPAEKPVAEYFFELKEINGLLWIGCKPGLVRNDLRSVVSLEEFYQFVDEGMRKKNPKFSSELVESKWRVIHSREWLEMTLLANDGKRVKYFLTKWLGMAPNGIVSVSLSFPVSDQGANQYQSIREKVISTFKIHSDPEPAESPLADELKGDPDPKLPQKSQ